MFVFPNFIRKFEECLWNFKNKSCVAKLFLISKYVRVLKKNRNSEKNSCLKNEFIILENIHKFQKNDLAFSNLHILRIVNVFKFDPLFKQCSGNFWKMFAF